MTTHPPVDQQILIRGFLRLYLLHHFATHGELCGADLSEQIVAINHGAYRPSPGSLYPWLNRLEAEGLLTSRWDTSAKPRKYYTITAQGQDELARQRAMMRPQLESAVRMLKNHIKAIWGDEPA